MDNVEIVIIKSNDILNNQVFYYRVHFYNGNFYAYNKMTGYLSIKDITSFIIEKDIQRVNGKLIKNTDTFQIVDNPPL
jgi:hypothetical protein